jgi:hypothetical protein
MPLTDSADFRFDDKGTLNNICFRLLRINPNKKSAETEIRSSRREASQEKFPLPRIFDLYYFVLGEAPRYTCLRWLFSAVLKERSRFCSPSWSAQRLWECSKIPESDFCLSGIMAAELNDGNPDNSHCR